LHPIDKVHVHDLEVKFVEGWKLKLSKQSIKTQTYTRITALDFKMQDYLKNEKNKIRRQLFARFRTGSHQRNTLAFEKDNKIRRRWKIWNRRQGSLRSHQTLQLVLTLQFIYPLASTPERLANPVGARQTTAFLKAFLFFSCSHKKNTFELMTPCIILSCQQGT